MARKQRGMTLLELILALGLTVLVFVAIGMALDLNMRTLDTRRTKVEEAQLARAILRRISDDLRGAVQVTPLDFSAVGQAAGGSPGGQSQNPSGQSPNQGGQGQGGQGQGGQGQGGQGQGGQGQGGQGQGGQGQGGQGQGGQGQGGQGQGGQGQGGQGQGGQGQGGQGQGGQGQGGQGQGGQGQGGQQGGQSGQGQSGQGQGQGSTGGTANTEDIASAVVPPAKLGLYGNQYQLQIDVSHLPRPDQYNPQLSAQGPNSAPNIPSDVKTVAYYMQLGTGGEIAVGSSAEATKQAEQQAGGLVRREIDRAVASYAGQNGLTDTLNAAGDVLAPEVTSIQFQYFDGTTWLLEWDSEANDGLPLAVKILVTIRSAAPSTRRPVLSGSTGDAPATTDLSYWLIVHLPLGKPPVSQESGLESLGL